MTTLSADIAAAGDGPEGPAPWQAVMETLAGKYPLVPRAIVAREIREACHGGDLADADEALAVEAIANSNLAAIHQALSEGARFACPQIPGSPGDRLPQPGTAGDPLDQDGHGDAAEDEAPAGL